MDADERASSPQGFGDARPQGCEDARQLTVKPGKIIPVDLSSPQGVGNARQDDEMRASANLEVLVLEAPRVKSDRDPM